MTCDNCLCNLKYCEAECCKEFRIGVPRIRLFRGLPLYFKEPDENMLYYFKTRGLEVEGDVVKVKLDKFKKVGNTLYIYHRCAMLDENNHCKLHNTPQQPKICKYPNKDNAGEGVVYLTKRCIYGKDN